MKAPRRLAGHEDITPEKSFDYYCTPDGVLEALQNPASNNEFLSCLRLLVEPLKNSVTDFKKDFERAIDALYLEPDAEIGVFLNQQLAKFRNVCDVDSNGPFIRHFNAVINLFNAGKINKEKVEYELKCLIDLLS